MFDGKVHSVDMNSATTIKHRGLYMLDNDSYFILCPNFIDEEKHSLLQNATQNLKYTAMGKRDTHYIGPTYSYANTSHAHNDKWPTEVVKIKGAIECEYGIPINSVLINKYDSDENFIPFHKDNETCLNPEPTIFSLTVGEKGIMSIKDKNEKVVEVILYPGCLLVMGGKFNENFYHSVKRPKSQKTRINLTFRYIYNKEAETKTTSQDTLAVLDTQIKELQSAISTIQPAKTYAEAASTEISNNKVVILKSEELGEPTIDSLFASLNKHLEKQKELLENPIVDFEDYRSKNGPLILNLRNAKVKAKLIKNFKNNTNLVLKDCLSKQANALRKKAKELKDKKLIEFYWSYRGDIYYIPKGKNSSRIKADWGRLNCLGRSDAPV